MPFPLQPDSNHLRIFFPRNLSFWILSPILSRNSVSSHLSRNVKKHFSSFSFLLPVRNLLAFRVDIMVRLLLPAGRPIRHLATATMTVLFPRLLDCTWSPSGFLLKSLFCPAYSLENERLWSASWKYCLPVCFPNLSRQSTLLSSGWFHSVVR